MLTCRNISLEDDLDWDSLIAGSLTATFFQVKEWLNLWKRHFGGKTEIIGVFEEGNLLGIAPLEIREDKVNFLGVNPVLGQQRVSDFGDILALAGQEKKVWQVVLSQFLPKEGSLFQPAGKKRKYQVELDFLREDSPSFRILKALGGQAEKVWEAPFIKLPKSWEVYLSSLTRHQRHELRRKIRRLKKEAVFLVSCQEKSGEMEEFFRLVSLSSSQKRSFLSTKMKAFFRDIFLTFWPKKMLKLCFLKIGGKNIAAVLLFFFKNEVLLYNSGFDPAYSYLAPGLLLKAFAIKKAIEEGKERFDFLQGEERYKYDLGGKKRNLYKISFSVII